MTPEEQGWQLSKRGNYWKKYAEWVVTIGYAPTTSNYWTQLRCANVKRTLPVAASLEDAIKEVDRIMGIDAGGMIDEAEEFVGAEDSGLEMSNRKAWTEN